MSSYGTVQVGLQGRSIDSALPLPLQPHINATEWSSFCDQVDTLLQRYQSKKKKVMLPTILIFGGVTLGFLLFGLGGFWSTQTFSISPLIPVAMVIFVFIAGMCLVRKIKSNVKADIQQVCEQAEFRNVTVHYKEEKIAYTNYNSNRRNQTKCYLEFIYGTAPAPATTRRICLCLCGS